MRSAIQLKKQGPYKWQGLSWGGQDESLVKPDSSSSPWGFSGHSLSAPEREHITNILNAVVGRWKEGTVTN